MNKPRYELADIFNRYIEGFLSSHKISKLQQKVVDAITACRTAKLGIHLLKCPNCDYSRQEYDSCRNRHCPRCQISNKIKWVGQRLEELLPIPYYHTVFTMPHALNPLALYNKELIYDIFFKAAASTLNLFAQDPKYLGAKPGFIGILHTWGQTLAYHVHVHFIVTAGGIANDGKSWLALPYREKFLFPVKALSKRMRKTFAELLDKAYHDGKLLFPDTIAHLAQPEAFQRFLDKVAWQNWVTYVKKPFAGPEDIVSYIGRYTHRIAISNYRLMNIKDGKVTFRYKKYRDGKLTHKTMTLSADEFIRRFLLHIIPEGFKRIRHFGFLANGVRRKSIKLARDLLQHLADKLEHVIEGFGRSFDNSDANQCPICHNPLIVLTGYG